MRCKEGVSAEEEGNGPETWCRIKGRSPPSLMLLQGTEGGGFRGVHGVQQLVQGPPRLPGGCRFRRSSTSATKIGWLYLSSSRCLLLILLDSFKTQISTRVHSQMLNVSSGPPRPAIPAATVRRTPPLVMSPMAGIFAGFRGPETWCRRPPRHGGSKVESMSEEVMKGENRRRSGTGRRRCGGEHHQRHPKVQCGGAQVVANGLVY
ncbi:uncharacterized protein LOC124653907 isoform X2 [Lolium rigidum]|uniref:uncharacterized protein LOC124651155 isoform X2 n=1 Tax=Lolium rigidum TaxID=89674 RepID=UPI001F5CCEE2|nr:uncharacterized protein LOC124651155 isoform X2 [Lolium rigidum]XP_047048921.1 uncharacterized protein LOC124653907 isoform X2 [Lolium rigidum]